MLITRLTTLSLLLCGLAAQIPAQKFSAIYQLGSGNAGGYAPVPGPNGDLYGNDSRALFQLAPPAEAGQAWKLTYLRVPGGNSPMVSARNGSFYVTESGNNVAPDYGAVYLLSPPSVPGGRWTQTAIYTFTGTPDGSLPSGNLIPNPDGSLCGITGGGGQYQRRNGVPANSSGIAGRRVDGNHSV